MTPKNNLNLTSVKCCICESEAATLIGKGKDFEYQTSSQAFLVRQCNSCGLVYLNPRPSTSEFEKIYPSTYHSLDFSKGDYGIVYKIRAWLEASRLMSICKNIPDDGKILDVGCGDGFHLDLLRKGGKKSWTLEGVDLDKRAAKAARAAGFQVYLGNIEESDLPDETYDLIFMIQTIEHVESPVEVVCKINKLLKKGGRLVIVTDNTDSLDFKFFKSGYWGGYHFPRHWNLFNQYSLSKLASKSGFEIEKFTTIISPVNWVYSFHNAFVDKKKSKWLINRFTLKSTFSLTVFTVLDFVLKKFGKGALLQAVLRKPL